ncbi:hypothetical protein J4732_19265 [Serratia marcescens]|uniref:Uncharacterized protein n=1 Tax=Serratia marcescens TaxID=615 RepID=A0A939NKL9_SERMA|nr:hypothetical protein [Serratia marcescens]
MAVTVMASSFASGAAAIARAGEQAGKQGQRTQNVIFIYFIGVAKN